MFTRTIKHALLLSCKKDWPSGWHAPHLEAQHIVVVPCSNCATAPGKPRSSGEARSPTRSTPSFTHAVPSPYYSHLCDLASQHHKMTASNTRAPHPAPAAASPRLRTPARVCSFSVHPPPPPPSLPHLCRPSPGIMDDVPEGMGREQSHTHGPTSTPPCTCRRQPAPPALPPAPPGPLPRLCYALPRPSLDTHTPWEAATQGSGPSHPACPPPRRRRCAATPRRRWGLGDGWAPLVRFKAVQHATWLASYVPRTCHVCGTFGAAARHGPG